MNSPWLLFQSLPPRSRLGVFAGGLLGAVVGWAAVAGLVGGLGQ